MLFPTDFTDSTDYLCESEAPVRTNFARRKPMENEAHRIHGFSQKQRKGGSIAKKMFSADNVNLFLR